MVNMALKMAGLEKEKVWYVEDNQTFDVLDPDSAGIFLFQSNFIGDNFV